MNSKFEPCKQKSSLKIDSLKNEFFSIYNTVDRSKSRFEIFQDLVGVMACSLRNSVGKLSTALFSLEVEEEYFRILKKYSKDDFEKFPELCGLVILLLEAHVTPYDVLGEIYMQLDFGAKYNAQYFTPSDISNLISDFHRESIDAQIHDKGYITVADPCCGSGSMLLAKVKTVIELGYNPANNIYIEGTDIDRLVALMCYIQMTLWNVPAKIFVGDSLNLKIREIWPTPILFLKNWNLKLS